MALSEGRRMVRPQVWCFDLDGTLLDTAEMNRQAYQAVGVKIPQSAAGLSWQEWLPEYCGGNIEIAATLHRAKTSLYLRHLIESDLEGMELPALEVARELYTDNPTRVKILTAAAILSTRRLMNRLGFEDVEYHAELQYEARRRHLASWSVHANVTYVDDNIKTIRQLNDDVTDPIINTVHYDGQDVATLKRQMEVPEWTR